MPTSVPLTTAVPGGVLTSGMWNLQLRDNIGKLLAQGHRSLTLAQFGALTGLEGTAGGVAGDEVYLIVDGPNGILWHLVYESTETTYKWRFLGGPWLVNYVGAMEPTASTSTAGVDLATVGPSITPARSGEYQYQFGCIAQNSVAGNLSHMLVPNLGGQEVIAGQTIYSSVSTGPRPQIAIAAATVVAAKYFGTAAGTATFGYRFLALRPVRLI